MLIARKGQWLTASVGEELVMMSESQGTYIGLTAIGARIWELLAAPQDIESLCQRLTQEFDVDADTCRADVDIFLKQLLDHDAITQRPVG